MASSFSQDTIETLVEKICAERSFTIKHIMSTSGSYYVALAVDAQDSEYIIKIRNHTDKASKEEFAKESFINQFFAEHPTTPFVTPEHVYIYNDSEPEALVYTSVIGNPLGWYYFYTGLGQIRKIGHEQLLSAIEFMQSSSSEISQRIVLPTVQVADLITNLQEHRAPALAAGLPETIYDYCEEVVAAYGQSWLKTPVLVHGDFNPKNILHTPNDGVGFIDWSDAKLGSKYYDLAFLWLTLWRTPEQQDAIVEATENSKELWQTICYWLPKFYRLLHDIETALNKEYTAGDIPEEALADNVAYINEAKAWYEPRLEQITKNGGAA